MNRNRNGHSGPDAGQLKKLEVLRKKIDDADQLLLRALSRRLKAVAKIGAIKRQAGMPIVQKQRWAQVLADRTRRAGKLNISRDFAVEFFESIQREAIRLQKKGK